MASNVSAPIEKLTDSELGRFRSYVGDPDERGCMLWLGGSTRGGYGTFSMRGKSRRAHRVAFVIAGHELTPGLTIDHICGVVRCVNPAHLREVSERENILGSRGMGARWAQRTHCDRGHTLDDAFTGRRGERVCSYCHPFYGQGPGGDRRSRQFRATMARGDAA